MTNLELKRKRIEAFVKIAALLAVGFVFQPFVFLAIKGLIGLIVAGIVSLFGVNVFFPWFAMKVANWRLKALKHEASLNPIETLENAFKQKQEALDKSRDNIKQTFTIVQNLANQIKTHNERFPNRPSQHLERFNKLRTLTKLRESKYILAFQQLVAFGELIEEKRSDWEIAKSMAEADKLSAVGQDFESKLKQDAALASIEHGLNFAFSELDASLMDEAAQNRVAEAQGQTTVTVAAPANPRQLTERAGPQTIDLDVLELPELAPAVARK